MIDILFVSEAQRAGIDHSYFSLMKIVQGKDAIVES